MLVISKNSEIGKISQNEGYDFFV